MLAAAAVALAGCMGGFNRPELPRAPTLSGISQTTHHGYVVSPTALEQIAPGSSRDQVLIALGSPSTQAEFGGEVFYYISQTRNRPVRFMQSRIVDQRVIAVYFNQRDEVERIADYGLQDGRVFDFVTRTTPTSGQDLNFLQAVLSAGPSRNLFGGSNQPGT